MVRESGLEKYIIRKVDRARARLQFGQVIHKEITDQAEIEKILTHARGSFNHFIYSKTSASKKRTLLLL